MAWKVEALQHRLCPGSTELSLWTPLAAAAVPVPVSGSCAVALPVLPVPRAAALRSPTALSSVVHAPQSPGPGIVSTALRARRFLSGAGGTAAGATAPPVDGKPLPSSDSASVPASVPPFLVRTALVGSTVGLLTPIFATAGVVRIWVKFRPCGPPGTYFYYALSMAAFGGIASFTFQTVLPFMMNNGNVVLPFALANGVAAATWYGVFETWLGLDVLARGDLGHILKPLTAQLSEGSLLRSVLSAAKLTGPVLGMLTAISAPYLWPLTISLCWGSDLKHMLIGDEPAWWLTEFASTFLWTVLVPIGAMAGFAMHHLLVPLLTGTLPGSWAGTPWTQTALPTILIVLAASVGYIAYSRVNVDDLHWVERVHPKSGQRSSFNTRTKDWSDDPSKADIAATTRILLLQADWVRMAPVRRLLRDQWEEFRLAAWGTQKSPAPPQRALPAQVAVNAEKVACIADRLLRLRHLTDEERLRSYGIHDEVLSSERQRFLEEAATIEPVVPDLERALLLAEAAVVATRLPDDPGVAVDAKVARRRLTQLLGGRLLDLGSFGQEYSELLGHSVAEERLLEYRGELAAERRAAAAAIHAAIRAKSLPALKKELQWARDICTSSELLAEGDAALKNFATHDLRAAIRSQRVRNIACAIQEARSAGVPHEEIDAAEVAVSQIKVLTRTNVEAAAAVGRLGPLQQAIMEAHYRQVDGDWLNEPTRQAKELRKEAELRWQSFVNKAFVVIVAFSLVTCCGFRR